MNKDNTGNRVALGAAIYMFFSFGFLGAYLSGFSLFPETYGVDVGLVSSSVTATVLLAFLLSMAYATIDSKIKVKGILYLSAFAILAASACLCFLSGLPGLVLAFALMGVANALGSFASVTEVISNWVVEGRAAKIGMAIGAGSFGQAALQYVAGQLFATFGLRTGFMILGIAVTAILVLVTKFMIIGSTPEEVGLVAYGATETPVETVDDIPAEVADPAKSGSLFSNPAFLVAAAARFLSAGGVMFVQMYATTYFVNAGFDLVTAASIVSAMSIVSALFTFVSGGVLSKIGTKPFVLLIVASAALSNLAMILFGITPGVPTIALILVLYGVGFTISSITNLIVDRLVPASDIADANSKFMAMMYGGNIVWLSSAGVIVGKFGFTALFVLIATLIAIALVLFFIALGIAKKQGVQTA